MGGGIQSASSKYRVNPGQRPRDEREKRKQGRDDEKRDDQKEKQDDSKLLKGLAPDTLKALNPAEKRPVINVVDLNVLIPKSEDTFPGE